MKKYIIFSLVLIGSMAFNLLVSHNVFWGCFNFFLYLFFYGRRLGILALPNFNQFWHRLLGPLLLLSGIAVVGSIIYYFYALTDYIIILLIVLFPLSLIPYCSIRKKDIGDWQSGLVEPVPLVEPSGQTVNFWAWVVIAGDIFLLFYLFSHGITEATRSPWLFISHKFFIAVFVLTYLLIIFVKKTKSSLYPLVAIFFHSLLFLSVAFFIYKLGFGFDPSLHRASEQYIYNLGSLLPKTPYYLGQYVLVVTLAKLTGLSLFLIDKTLLIILEAVFLPLAMFICLRHGLNWERSQARLGSLLFFALPFSQMVATTPQALANFFALMVFFLGITYLNTTLIKWWVIIALTCTVIVIHPLAGLPTAFFCALVFLLKIRSKVKPALQIIFEILIFIFFVCSLIALPLIFINHLGATFAWPTLEQIWRFLPALPTPRPGQALSWIFTPLYFFNFFLPWKILFLSIIGARVLIKNKTYSNVAGLLILSFLAFSINAGILKFALTFANIGAAEQGQYAERLYLLSFYLLLPLFLVGLFQFLKWIKLNWQKSIIILPLILAGILTSSFYLSYPAVNNYALSHYINTSISDIKAVREIEEKSGGEPYIVLSNISFSAAAIQEFGYKKYFTTPQGDVFFYSLPTGGPLYHVFEKMSYISADKATITEAMDLVGVKQAFFVLNDYWDSYAKALPQAMASADESWQVDGKIWVMRYKKE